MDKQKDPLLNSEDALNAENALLKFKLGLEYGMQTTELSPLPPDVENQWLKSVYAFEQQFKDAKRVKLYDYLGRPSFKKCEELAREEIADERRRLELIMEQSDVRLECVCEYDDVLIYRFITEELFEQEMDDMHVPGMVYHFIYEEFHPNHDYDLRQSCEYFISSLFTRDWDPEFDSYKLADKISFAGTEYDQSAISDIIKTFQESHLTFETAKFEVTTVTIDLAITTADVQGHLQWSGHLTLGVNVQHEGVCSFRFVRQDESWNIAGFDIAGMKPVTNDE